MKYVYIAFVLLLLVACNIQVPADYTASRSKPDIYPDYKDVTIPVNMAPLTFEMIDDCEWFDNSARCR